MQEKPETSSAAAPSELPWTVILRGVGWNALAVLIWGGWMVVTGLGVQAGLDALDVTAIRLGVAGLLLVPVVVRQGFALDRLGWLGFIGLVAGAGAPFVFVLVMGMSFAPVRHASALINGVIPIIVAGLSWILFREKIVGLRLAGLALIFAGVVGFWTEGLADPAMRIGHAFFLAGAFLWASFTVAARYGGISPLHAAAIVSVVSMILYLPPYFYVFGAKLFAAPPFMLAIQVVYQAMLAGVVAIVAFVRGIALLGASRSAAFTPLSPVVAMVLAIPVLDDWPNAQDLVSIVAVTTGVVLATGVIGRTRA